MSESTETVLQMRRSGMSLGDIAKATNLAKGYCGEICRRAGLGGRIAVQPQKLTEEEVCRFVEQSGFDYVGGYHGSKKPITVRCRKCGQTFERLFHSFRDSLSGTRNNECPICREIAKAKRIDEEQGQKERDAQIRAQRKAEQLSRKVNDHVTMRLANHVCKNCGADFCIELTGYNSDTYCSKRCQQRWHERIKNEKRMDKLKARPHDTDITLEKLFKRDGGVCYICGCLCNWKDIVEKDGTMIAGDSYPSIDHVKPVSKGGTHTWANIKLACRSCNTKKGWR